MSEKNNDLLNIVLVGNPNTGKTTFFNAITNSDEHVGNWHGVTVDYKEKVVNYNKQKVVITDLPGLYSLSTYSYEEAVARDYIYNNDAKIVNLCDANNLARNLYLTLQLIELGLKPVVCINMANELKKGNKEIDIQKLEKILGVKIFLINAQKKSEVKKVIDFVLSDKYSQQQPKKLEYIEKFNTQKICDIIDNKKINSKISKEYLALKILEEDEFILARFGREVREKVKFFQEQFSPEQVANARYDFIEKLAKDCIKVKDTEKSYGYSKIDKIVLNKYLALPIFLLIISLIFFITFSSVGSFLSDLLSNGLNKFIATPIINFVKSKTSNEYLISFVRDAIFGGVGSLLTFIPQIVLLFLSLSILEDTGYMSRLAFTLEDYFAKIGLTGKSVFTLLMGFGCSTTACMTSRNLEDKNSKIKTAMLAPYISCSAKIPIYTILCSAFFKAKFLVIIGLYLLSVIIAVLVSAFMEKTILKSGEQSFIMELPPYRFPSLKRILNLVLSNIKTFVLRVGTMIVSFSIIIWILQSCDFTFRYNTENSILKNIGFVLAPIFKPLGFGSWGAVSCLICGIVAKEVIVGSMAIINNITSETNTNNLISQSLLLSSSALYFTPCSALSFLIFSLLYCPCISTIGVMVKEIGKKWTFIAILIQFSIAYILSYMAYKIYSCFYYNGVVSGIISVLIFTVIISAIIFTIKFLKKKKNCKFCLNKSNCNNK